MLCVVLYCVVLWSILDNEVWCYVIRFSVVGYVVVYDVMWRSLFLCGVRCFDVVWCGLFCVM